MPKSDAWKVFERVVAATWGSHRVPLSGISSRHNAGDVILPKGVRALLECKTRANNSFYTMFRKAQHDAIKNGIPEDNTVLYFKRKGDNGYIVTVSGALFEKMMQTDARKLFDDDDFR